MRVSTCSTRGYEVGGCSLPGDSWPASRQLAATRSPGEFQQRTIRSARWRESDLSCWIGWSFGKSPELLSGLIACSARSLVEEPASLCRSPFFFSPGGGVGVGFLAYRLCRFRR